MRIAPVVAVLLGSMTASSAGLSQSPSQRWIPGLPVPVPSLGGDGR